MEYLLGIDVSTTATKALLLDTKGSVVAVGATEYPFDTPQPLWSEQDPPVWWFAAVHSIGDALQAAGAKPEEIRAIGLTGQMHGLVMLNKDGSIMRPSILWNDQRNASLSWRQRQTSAASSFPLEAHTNSIVGIRPLTTSSVVYAD